MPPPSWSPNRTRASTADLDVDPAGVTFAGRRSAVRATPLTLQVDAATGHAGPTVARVRGGLPRTDVVLAVVLAAARRAQRGARPARRRAGGAHGARRAADERRARLALAGTRPHPRPRAGAGSGADPAGSGARLDLGLRGLPRHRLLRRGRLERRRGPPWAARPSSGCCGCRSGWSTGTTTCSSSWCSAARGCSVGWCSSGEPERMVAELNSGERARLAVAEERARIARELHDVVAHGVSVIAVQADAAQAVLDVDPERAREPLGVIRTSAREVLDEMRQLLALLRPDGDETVHPQPGLADVEELVASVRAAGLPVRLEVTGDVRRAAGGRGPVGVPDRAGGADQRAQARGAGRRRPCSSQHADDAVTVEVRNAAGPPAAPSRAARGPRARGRARAGQPGGRAAGRWGRRPTAGSSSGRACRARAIGGTHDHASCWSTTRSSCAPASG